MRNWPKLVISVLLGTGGVALLRLKNVSPDLSRIQIGIGVGLLVASIGLSIAFLSPWLRLDRRKQFKADAANKSVWMGASTVLLRVALLFGPLATLSPYLLVKAVDPTGVDVGGKSIVGLLLIAYLLNCIGGVACIIAVLIQLWRHQWRSVLSTLAITYYLLAFLYLFGMSH